MNQPTSTASIGTGENRVFSNRWIQRLFWSLSCLCALPHPGTAQLVSPSARLQGGTEIEVRLSSATGSRISHSGDPIKAVVIAPVIEDGRVVIPQGALLLGSIGMVNRLGFGLKHSMASLEFKFESIQLPQAKPVAIASRVVEVETAKERVNANGIVRGIHPVANLSSGVSIFISALLMQPAIAVPVIGVKFLIARCPDPEIYFPSGTELIVQVSNSVDVPALDSDSRRLSTLSAQDESQARRILETAPRQQTMRAPDLPSDLANVLLLGKQAEIDRAFHAAGWTGTQGHNPMALYRIFHSMVQRRGYSMAPMAKLTLNGVLPQASYQKSLDTFAKRHHVRLWDQGHSDAWLSAASEDLSFTVSRMHVTHYSDRKIDNERSKVVNDLAMTGCVDSAGVLPRESLHVDPEGKRVIVTDKEIAVVRLNDCTHPVNVVAAADRHPLLLRLSHAPAAIARDIVRSNPVSLGYSATKMIFAKSDRPVEERTLAQTHHHPKSETSQVVLSRWKRQTVIPAHPAMVGYSSSDR